MTLQQGLAFGLIALTIAAFIWGRFRYDLVALAALVAGLAVGVIPAEAAFDGFKSDVTVIIAAALIVSAAFARSGVIELALRRVLPLLKTERSQTPALTVFVTLLSMVTKNVGALAIMLPVALQLARRTGSAPSRLLMPMAFGAMAGGMVTLVGTAPNIIVADVRREIVGEPFGMFDYSAVGLGLTALALVFLAFGYRLLPRDRQGATSLDSALASSAYATEVSAPKDWPPGSMTVAALDESGGGEVTILARLRGGKKTTDPHGNTRVKAGDVLLVEGEQQALEAFVSRAQLKLVRSENPVNGEDARDEVSVVEAVIGRRSGLAGQTARQSELYSQHQINLLGVSRSGYTLTRPLRSTRLATGDIILLQGASKRLPDALKALDLLPLAEREVRLGSGRRRFLPAVILAVAMTLVGFGLVPVAVAFFAAAVIIVALGGLTMREAYGALDGPLLVLIAALIPVSEAIQRTGGADLIAGWLSGVFTGLPGLAAIAGVLFAAMVVTPFLNNAATVLILAPIGATLARQLGYNPDPFLMAVAVGAACDFLTPIGHQCNTLVMGPGGYRFGDYARLGAPLSLLVLIVGPPLILAVWPLS
ncbi:SLC13 family permease [Brevundimonas lutea]|uniref:SLC13 family permease n=1 Tax=Brevundimonas lutea TaxID=2293980 RepID=UPI000F01F915|nr:SLC13 family permease [Brevundimonas lutea]